MQAHYRPRQQKKSSKKTFNNRSAISDHKTIVNHK